MDLPPPLYLLQVLQHCCKAGFTYCRLWNEANDSLNVSYTFPEIKEQFVSLAAFRHNLRLLLREGVIAHVSESLQEISVELTPWQVEEELYDTDCML